ncbi:uncharacterized protein PHACADRAFT_254850 [Phanerochaete carnosa HHB-10118-sp]|uniref:Uncharacterized protein n=1 Tax=Phanerochaete carnosa (strain HHB-10118-sp) TaxID=650164 RepID=K5WDS9_PHACS|nr:uncharacterized protein PHACADRAFT_254850 [Phanerochaete carnosa HHB-10118-sp]EKM57204.1 hypothetical protein PHACADRAFT_254850 [Phanerochaete carnosa HHB-10118-sp]
MTLTAPARHEIVAAFGDLTSVPALPTLQDHMLASSEGRRFIKEASHQHENRRHKIARNPPQSAFGRT